MIKAILTIDDVASVNTPAIVDYLAEHDIPALMFGWGENIENHHEEALYALKHGFIIGNHSYSHPHFSEISFEEGVAEIEKNEEILNALYQEAGVERKYRPFRFPYGDRGGDNMEAFQNYFKEHGFNKVKDTDIPYSWWKEQANDKLIDTLWTFDFAEYMVRKDSGVTIQDVFNKMNDQSPENPAPLYADGSTHILLLHAHDETEELVPEYYKLMLGQLLDKGVTFISPEFV